MIDLNQKQIATGLGEILWDLLPSGKILGGAPANFAFHLNSLGVKSFPISAVGEDSLGNEIISLLHSNSLSTEYIQKSSEYETGIVDVKVDSDGKPTYNILENVAWDNIKSTSSLTEIAQKCSAVCFGSLAQRSEESRETIKNFLTETSRDCVRVFDINLRQNYYSNVIIDESLKVATVLKLNDEELPIVSEMFGFSGSYESILHELQTQYDLDLIALTKGGDGSQLIMPDDESFIKPSKIKIVDTIGAGDAFTAGLVYGLLSKMVLNDIHNVASSLASIVCSRKGATPQISNEEKIGFLK